MPCGESLPIRGKQCNAVECGGSGVEPEPTNCNRSPDLRKTGIGIVGDVGWGTHFCQFYQTRQDLIDTLVPYFKAGLESNEFCMWVTSEPLDTDTAKQSLQAVVPDLDRRLAEGQIEIIPHTQWYLIDGVFDQKRVLDGWVQKMNAALERGYSGLRLTGNTFWLEKGHWDSFTQYEEVVNSVLGSYKMLALCTYCIDRCGAGEIADVVANHEFAIMKRGGNWSVIESSTVKQTKQALQNTLNELDARTKELEHLNEELVVSGEEIEAQNEELRAGNEELQWEIEERKRAQEALARLAAIVESSDDAIIGKTLDGTITSWNRGAQNVYGYTAEEVLGRSISILCPQDWGDDVPEILQRIGRGELVEHYDTQRIRKGGEMISVSLSVSPIKNAEGLIVGASTIARDITERKKVEHALQQAMEQLEASSQELSDANEELVVSNEELEAMNEELRNWEDEMRQEIQERARIEEQLQKVNRTLNAHSDSSQAMMRARNEMAYLRRVCGIILDDCGHKMVWIGYADDDEEKTVHPVASAGFDHGYLETLDITWADTPRGRGPTGTAIRTGKPSACRNMLTDPQFEPWREQAIVRGYASSIALPLVADGRSFGAITIYSTDPDPFTKDEVALLTELADDVSYAVASIRLQQEQVRSEEALRESEQRVRIEAGQYSFS